MKPARSEAYRAAQDGLTCLKVAIHALLEGQAGMTNVEIGRALGIYQGHVGHEGHIPRTLLAMMEAEGVVQQDQDKRWRLRSSVLAPAKTKPDMRAAALTAWETIRTNAAAGKRGTNYDRVRAKLVRDGQLAHYQKLARSRGIRFTPNGRARS
jgi:hypothetical protein